MLALAAPGGGSVALEPRHFFDETVSYMHPAAPASLVHGAGPDAPTPPIVTAAPIAPDTYAMRAHLIFNGREYRAEWQATGAELNDPLAEHIRLDDTTHLVVRFRGGEADYLRIDRPLAAVCAELPHDGDATRMYEAADAHAAMRDRVHEQLIGAARKVMAGAHRTRSWKSAKPSKGGKKGGKFSKAKAGAKKKFGKARVGAKKGFSKAKTKITGSKKYKAARSKFSKGGTKGGKKGGSKQSRDKTSKTKNKAKAKDKKKSKKDDKQKKQKQKKEPKKKGEAKKGAAPAGGGPGAAGGTPSLGGGGGGGNSGGAPPQQPEAPPAYSSYGGGGYGFGGGGYGGAPVDPYANDAPQRTPLTQIVYAPPGVKPLEEPEKPYAPADEEKKEPTDEGGEGEEEQPIGFYMPFVSQFVPSGGMSYSVDHYLDTSSHGQGMRANWQARSGANLPADSGDTSSDSVSETSSDSDDSSQSSSDNDAWAIAANRGIRLSSWIDVSDDDSDWSTSDGPSDDTSDIASEGSSDAASDWSSDASDDASEASSGASDDASGSDSDWSSDSDEIPLLGQDLMARFADDDSLFGCLVRAVAASASADEPHVYAADIAAALCMQ